MNNLRTIRKAKKLTMKQLGEMVGVTESMIGQIETNKRHPSYETLLKLGEALDCSVEDIISEKNPATINDDGLDAELLKRLMMLTPEEILKVDAFVQGLLASR